MYMHMLYKHAFANQCIIRMKQRLHVNYTDTCVVYFHSFGDQEGKFIEPSIFDMVDIVKSLLG